MLHLKFKLVIIVNTFKVKNYIIYILNKNYLQFGKLVTIDFIFLLSFYAQGLGQWFSTLAALRNPLGSFTKHWWLDFTPRNCSSVGFCVQSGRSSKVVELLGSSKFFFFFKLLLMSAFPSLMQWYAYAQYNHLTSNLMCLLEVLPHLFCFQVPSFICPSIPFSLLFVFQFVGTVW